MCMKEISTGDELYHIGGNKFVCKEDYDLQLHEIEREFFFPKVIFIYVQMYIYIYIYINIYIYIYVYLIQGISLMYCNYY